MVTRFCRRDFLKRAGLTLGSVFMAGCGQGANLFAVDAASRKPNVLFISVDDLNDWVGCLGGHPDTVTPNLDRLAQRSVLFTNAHCAAPACGPSRAALMTGIRPASSGIYVNWQHFRRSPVLKDAVTLPQHFMAHGYRAMGAGKIFHGRDPDPASWQEYWPSQTKNRPDDPMPANRPLNGIAKTQHFDWGPVDADCEQMGDRRVADWVIGQLRKKQARPFFLGCGFYRPHLPWYVPKKYFDKFPLDEIALPNVKEDDLEDVPEAGRRMAKPGGDHKKVTEHKQWRKAVQGYLASINFVDECVGRVIDALDESAYRDNTVIVLWSDHGWHLGEKLHWRKFALWEEATHNVMMFAGAGIKQRAARCDEPVNLIDIYPTLIDLCGLSKKRELEGMSLAPYLKNPGLHREEPSLTTYKLGNHSLRSKRWRYIRYRDGSEELYDHQNDPLEWNNLVGEADYAEVKAELAKYLPEKDAPFVHNKKKS